MIGHPVPQTECPCCGYFMDACSNIQKGVDVAPTPGDHTICFKCGAPLDFDEGLKLRLVPADVFKTPEYDAVRKVQQKLLAFRRASC